MLRTAAALAGLFAASAVQAEELPRPVPATRPEMKERLEEMKARKPRIPLPELTAAEKEKLGERGNSYESRLRYHYLGETGTARGGASAFGFGREPDANASLDNKFKVQLFWIVSRANNCQYCLGHQESKLLAAGMTEDEIAALDGDWADASPKERAAYAFARKYTFEPHRLNDADISELKKHFTEMQIVEMTLSMAGNNAINRWKEGAGIPQSENGGNFGRRGPNGEVAPADPAKPAPKQDYRTPTSDRFRAAVSKVAPLVREPRPALEHPAETARLLEVARTRTPRLPLADEAKAKELLPEGAATGPVPQWARLMANFPNQAKGRIAAQISGETKGDLDPLLKAQVSWVVARYDRAWYAAALAKKRLLALGQTEEQIAALDGDWAAFPPARRAQFVLARNLAASPVALTDAQVEEAVKLTGPRDTTQLISYVTLCASFDRITETAGLRAE